MSLVYLPHEASPPQKDALWALSWSSAGLLSGGADGIVRIHDAAALADAEPTALPRLPLAISSLSAARERFALATSLDGTCALIDVPKGEVVSRIDTAAAAGGGVPGYASAIHPDASAWACAGRGAKIALGSITDGALASSSVVDTGKGRFGMSVSWSPDGTHLAAGFETGHVLVVDTATSTVVATYAAHALPVRALSWSPDSQWLYSGADDARVVLHDVRAGGAGASKGEGAVAVLQGHRSWVLGLAAGERLLASGSADATVKLWDVGQRTCVSTTSADAEVWGVAWQPGGDKQFAMAGDDKKVSLYRAAGTA